MPKAIALLLKLLLLFGRAACAYFFLSLYPFKMPVKLLSILFNSTQLYAIYTSYFYFWINILVLCFAIPFTVPLSSLFYQLFYLRLLSSTSSSTFSFTPLYWRVYSLLPGSTLLLVCWSTTLSFHLAYLFLASPTLFYYSLK